MGYIENIYKPGSRRPRHIRNIMNAISKKITGFKVKTESQPENFNEESPRPEEIFGCTYKITPTGMDCAMYITINDIELHGKRRPYEIFINTKSIESFEWVTIFTRLVSAVWRNGGNYEFLTKEMLATFAPKGGYFQKDHGYIPSIVAHIGIIIEAHLKK